MKKVVVSLVFVCVLASVLFAQRVTYKNDKGASLEVINDLDENIVLFLGAVNKRNFLGGVKGGDSRLVAIRSKLNGNSGVVLVRAVKESVFKDKKYRLDDDDVIFAKIVVYDKDSASLDGSIRVSSSVGGDVGLRIANDSSYALELRLNKPDGPVFTTFSPNERARIVSMQQNPRGYTIFPTYIYYDDNRKTLSSISTKNLMGGQLMNPRTLDSAAGIPIIRFEGPGEGQQSPIHPVSYITLVNESGGGVILVNGSIERISQKGEITLNNGESDTYEIAISPNSADSMVVRSLMLDTGRGAQGRMQVEPFNLQRGYDYTLEFYNDGGGLKVDVTEGARRGFNVGGSLLNLANEN